MKRSLFLLFVFAAFTLQTAQAQVPQTLGYQGVLTDTDGNPLADDDYSLTFSLYAEALGGDALWTETQSVPVGGGVFSAVLGSVTPLDLPFNAPYWLGVAVGSDDELAPRIALAASAYSLAARSVQGETNVVPSSGAVGIGTATPDPAYALDVSGDVQITSAGTGKREGGGGIRIQEGNVNLTGSNLTHTGDSHTWTAEDGTVLFNLDVLKDKKPNLPQGMTVGDPDNPILTIEPGALVVGPSMIITSTVTFNDPEGSGAILIDPANGITYPDGTMQTTAGGGGMVFDGTLDNTPLIIKNEGGNDALSFFPTGIINGPDINIQTGANNLLALINDEVEIKSGNQINLASGTTDVTLDGGSGQVAIQGPDILIGTGANNLLTGNDEGIEINSPGPLNFIGSAVTTRADDALVAVVNEWKVEGSGGSPLLNVNGQNTTVHGPAFFNSGFQVQNASGSATDVAVTFKGIQVGESGSGILIKDELGNPGTELVPGGGVRVFNGDGSLAIEILPNQDPSSQYTVKINGNLEVMGMLSKQSGSFKIDHPLDPENKYLYHSFVESPDMMNVYNGNAVLDAQGEASVVLPTYFEALNRDFRYQLTAVGAPGPNLYVADKIQGNRFKIAGGAPGSEVSWQVTGVRQDAYAKENRIQVEVDKK